MGGSGSGNHYPWSRSGKKITVEECKSLDAARWMREGLLKAQVYTSGSASWSYPNGTGFTVNFAVNTLDLANATVRLSYSWVGTATKQQESVEYHIRLTTTRPRFGGLRWWFTCPLVVNDRPCGRRVAKLYLPASARYFGCRHCYSLTYRSVQQHDQRVDALRKNPAAIQAILDNHHPCDRRVNLALKALRRRRGG